MADYIIQGETLDDIAQAINAKTGGSSAMTPAQMVTAIGSISGGGENIVLLASGTFSYTGSSNSQMTIPVSYIGHPRQVYIKATGSNTQNKTYDWLWFDAVSFLKSEFSSLFGSVFSSARHMYNKAVESDVSCTAVTVLSDEITVNAIGSAWPIRQTDYSWEIWGIAST